jgi:hypothetical protein
MAQNRQSAICVTVTGPAGRPVAHACGKPARGDLARPARKRKQDPPGDSPPHGPIPPALQSLTPVEPGRPAGHLPDTGTPVGLRARRAL